MVKRYIRVKSCHVCMMAFLCYRKLGMRKALIILYFHVKGRKTDWKLVRDYLKMFVGDCYEVEQSSEKIYIGGKLPDEYTGSESRIALKKAEAKAKANVTQGIPELIETAANPIWEENNKLKHEKDAKYGWYRYDVRFAIPVYNDAGELDRYNIFAASLLVNHSANGKKYLYDILNIKKETSRPQHDV